MHIRVTPNDLWDYQDKQIDTFPECEPANTHDIDRVDGRAQARVWSELLRVY